MMTKISIVTINLNNAIGLQKTIDSIFSQTFTNYECIIIDGGSNDGSKEIIELNNKKFNYWISENDTGIYNAMNKGIRFAKGEYILFLNSGDILINNRILETILPVLSNEDIIYGNLIIKESISEWVKTYPFTPDFIYFVNDTLPHSGGSFIKRSIFEIIGLYDETLKITSDWKFYMIAIFKHDVSTKYINEIIAVFAFDGISSKAENSKIIYLEKEYFLENTFGHYYKLYKEFNQIKNKKDFYDSITDDFFIKKYLKIRKIRAFLKKSIKQITI